MTENWIWYNYKDPDQARSTLNSWIKKRGEAVHRAQTDQTKPHIAKREELDKCLRFFNDLAQATDKALLEAWTFNKKINPTGLQNARPVILVVSLNKNDR